MGVVNKNKMFNNDTLKIWTTNLQIHKTVCMTKEFDHYTMAFIVSTVR